MKDYTFIPTNWIPDDSNIKAIGVGGAGQNAVTHMYNEHIEGCTFIVCNTDRQALDGSNVPIKIHLGTGMGAGTDPVKGRNAALEGMAEIEKQVCNGTTEMLFVTAGMGGGTGTGAAPVIAAMAKKKGILTVGVVTIPFKNECHDAMVKAVDGIHELEKNVDALLVIDNEKIYKVYSDMNVKDAYHKADEVLATAVRGIVDIIKKKGYVNVDMEDVKTIMRDSGVALMGIGEGKGENRLEDAVKGAVVSPLLNDFDLSTAKSILINITTGYGESGLKMCDLKAIDVLLEKYTGNANRFKRGIVYDYDEKVDDTITITVIATGFKMESLRDMTDESLGNIIEIGSDFQDTPGVDEVMDEVRNVKVTATDNLNERKFNYEEAPVMARYKEGKMAELRLVPAFKRAMSNKQSI